METGTEKQRLGAEENKIDSKKKKKLVQVIKYL